jgi:putative transcriptional regulator
MISKSKSVKPRGNNLKKSVSKNRITEVVYETAVGLCRAGAIKKTTMREFDDLCLPAVPTYTAKQIQAIRDKCHASQRVFAAYLNVSPSSLQKWETGARRPDRTAQKLLQLVDKKGLDVLAV